MNATTNTKLQQFKKDKREAKHSMTFHRPMRGFLGSQFSYWESKYEEAKANIESFRFNRKHNL